MTADERSVSKDLTGKTFSTQLQRKYAVEYYDNAARSTNKIWQPVRATAEGRRQEAEVDGKFPGLAFRRMLARWNSAIVRKPVVVQGSGRVGQVRLTNMEAECRPGWM